MAENHTKKPEQTASIDEIWKKMDEQIDAAVQNFCSASDKLCDVLINCPPDKVNQIVDALPMIDPLKKDTGKSSIAHKLAKLRGKKMVAILAVLGVMALMGALKSGGKNQTRSEVKQSTPVTQNVSGTRHTTQDKTLAVLQVLAEDPHAFDGIEIKDSMESDNIMMNEKMLDALDGALKKAGYLDKDGKLKPMRMVDFSKADALPALEAGLRAPKVYGD